MIGWSSWGRGPRPLTFFAAKDWLVDRRKAIGRTALCLSGGGSLAMHHMGVCRFLLEDLVFFGEKHP